MDARTALRTVTPAAVRAPRVRRRVRPTAAAQEAAGPSSRLYVARRFGVDVAESALAGRRLRDYVRLPAQQYNVLDTNAVTRVSDNVFRVSTGVQRMLMFEAEPVGLVEINVLPDGVQQSMRKAELKARKPSKVLDEVNATLANLQLQNTITAEDSPEGGRQIVCELVLDGTFTRGVLARVPEERLNGLMSWALGTVMPWFLLKLRDDYALWAADKPRTGSAAGAGEMSVLARKMLASGGVTLPPGVRELPTAAALSGAVVAPLAPSQQETGTTEA
jgi:hypothetical protein